MLVRVLWGARALGRVLLEVLVTGVVQVQFWGFGAVGNSEWLESPLRPRSRVQIFDPCYAIRYVCRCMFFFVFCVTDTFTVLLRFWCGVYCQFGEDMGCPPKHPIETCMIFPMSFWGRSIKCSSYHILHVFSTPEANQSATMPMSSPLPLPVAQTRTCQPL